MLASVHLTPSMTIRNRSGRLRTMMAGSVTPLWIAATTASRRGGQPDGVKGDQRL
jgi:hypothetical protein